MNEINIIYLKHLLALLQNTSDLIMKIADETSCRDDETYFLGWSRGIDYSIEFFEEVIKEREENVIQQENTDAKR